MKPSWPEPACVARLVMSITRRFAFRASTRTRESSMSAAPARSCPPAINLKQRQRLIILGDQNGDGRAQTADDPELLKEHLGVDIRRREREVEELRRWCDRP